MPCLVFTLWLMASVGLEWKTVVSFHLFPKGEKSHTGSEGGVYLCGADGLTWSRVALDMR